VKLLPGFFRISKFILTQTGWRWRFSFKTSCIKSNKINFQSKLIKVISQNAFAEKFTELTNSQANYILSHKGTDGLRAESFQQCTEGSLPKRSVETLADDKVVIQSLLLFEVELKKSNSYDGYLLPKNA